MLFLVSYHFEVDLLGLVTIDNEAETAPPFDIDIKFLKPMDTVRYFFGFACLLEKYADLLRRFKLAASDPAEIFLPNHISRSQAVRKANLGSILTSEVQHLF